MQEILDPLLAWGKGHDHMLKKTNGVGLEWLLLGLFLLAPSVAMSKPLNGVGDLMFGMSPEAVEALPGCSTYDECLYELLGKNRYFTLSYDSPAPSEETPSPPRPDKSSKLRTIDVDMGNYTAEWFMELFEVLQSQYAMAHSPTEQEDALFQQGKHPELIIGFADGHVLLKVVRRKFGNLILRVVFQDETSATQSRQSWAMSPLPAVPIP